MYFQFLLALDRVKAMAPQHPEWKEKEPFASLLKGDVRGALAGGERSMVEIVMATYAGMTTEEFEKIVKEWIATARHPTTKPPHAEMVYQPMVELLAYLRANGFKTSSRRPIAAFGNSDGDLQMLQWSAAGAGPRSCLYVHRTDAEREWAYDRKSPIGALDQGLDEAAAKEWTVVDMKQEWKVVFPPAKQ